CSTIGLCSVCCVCAFEPVAIFDFSSPPTALAGCIIERELPARPDAVLVVEAVVAAVVAFDSIVPSLAGCPPFGEGFAADTGSGLRLIVNLLPLSAYSTEYMVVPLDTVLIGAASNFISCGVVMLTMRGVVGTQLFLMIGCVRSGVFVTFDGTIAPLLAAVLDGGRFASDSAWMMVGPVRAGSMLRMRLVVLSLLAAGPRSGRWNNTDRFRFGGCWLNGYDGRWEDARQYRVGRFRQARITLEIIDEGRPFVDQIHQAVRCCAGTTTACTGPTVGPTTRLRWGTLAYIRIHWPRPDECADALVALQQQPELCVLPVLEQTLAETTCRF
uniref:Uncharacterized protein n=1 Tax=Anopheles maculatus TaxID=74869 RepID=A0A182SEZ2_9DIPT